MLEKEKFDAIDTYQSFTRHYTILKEVLAAKVPVFIEKLLAISVQSGKKIIEEIEKANTWVMVGYHKRNDPAVIYAKRKIEEFKESNEIGKMKYVRITMPPGDWIAGSFKELIKTEEGIPFEYDPVPRDMDKQTYEFYLSFINYYIHQVNLLQYLLGENYRVRYADKSKVLMVVESESGIPGIIEMAPYSTTTGWHEKATVYFERGFIEISLPAPLAHNTSGKLNIYIDRNEPEKRKIFLPAMDAMYRQALNFVRSVKEVEKPACIAQEALEDLEVALEYVRLVCR